MEALHNNLGFLRQWVYSLRRKYQRKPAKVYVYQDGLPEGLDHDLLRSVCLTHFERQIQSVRYTHLSGWKSAGAYRLRIILSSGPDIYLIFKFANYEHAEIPALRDFPLAPGLAEYRIYSQTVGPLADYLPKVYLAEEVQAGINYRYLLEDLFSEYRMARSDDLRIQAARRLPELHRALDAWAAQASTGGLLSFGQPFSEQLQNYVRAGLERYRQYSDSPAIQSILANWDDIAQMHLSPEFFAQPLQLIHGDANFSNFHMHRKDRSRFKIVDWEWAGFGNPYSDLASLLKSGYAALEKRGFESYFKQITSDTAEHRLTQSNRDRTAHHWRQYLWSHLERALIDSAFLAAQVLDASYQTRVNLPKAVNDSLLRVQSFYDQLSK